MSGLKDGFARGIRACSDMLREMDPDECQIANNCRYGRPQDNAVRRTLGQILMRGDAAELDGFCAVLSEIVAIADESNHHWAEFAKLADRRERVVERIAKRQAARSA